MNLKLGFNEAVIQVSTLGRRNGKGHEVELWFVGKGNAVYLLANIDSDWWRNIKATPAVQFRIVAKRHVGTGRLADEHREIVFTMFREKYGSSQIDEWYDGPRSQRRVIEISIDRAL